MQDMMFLVIVSDLHFGAQCERSCIRWNDLVEDLEQCRLASSIVADHSNVFSTFDFKADILKKHLAVKSLGKIFDHQYIITAYAGRFQCQMHLLCSILGLLDQRHLVEQLFTALGTLDGLLTVKGAELLDYGLLVLDLALLVEIFL